MVGRYPAELMAVGSVSRPEPSAVPVRRNEDEMMELVVTLTVLLSLSSAC